MAWRLLAGTCDNGPCPTIYIDDTTLDIRVQGYDIDEPLVLPDGEGMVHIPAEDWRKILHQLPASMITEALRGRLSTMLDGQ